VEVRATALLLESSGIINKNGPVTPAAEEQFGEKFVGQLDSDFVGGLRSALGLPAAGNVGVLDALALAGEE
jgi:hypothetical protein